jgi:hypothetical protein
MRFPIDTTPPQEILAFSPLFLGLGHIVPHLAGMIRYLCYRYDQSSEVFGTSVIGHEARDRRASELASWDPPMQMMDDETHCPIGDYAVFLEVTALWFRAYDNDEWEYIVSLDEMIHNCHKVMREPLPADPEAKAKMIINVQRAAEGARDAIRDRRAAAKALADNSEALATAILHGTKKVARASTSPEGNLKSR